MNCEQFEELMAEALGGELSPSNRTVFEEHLSACDRCRREHTILVEAVNAMRALPGPERVTVRRDGDRLVIQENDRPGVTRRHSAARAWWAGGVVRYAAALLIAFTAGYIVRGTIRTQTPTPVTQVIPTGHEPPGGGKTLEGALTSTYARNPGRSGLAQALIAMAKPSP